MRFNTINLVRYGCFEGQALDFGGAPENDFHIIYGPNEAGKSTIRDACIDFLFGFPRITPYNFLHDNNTLAINAEMQFADGNAFSATRIKKTDNSLLDENSRPLPTSPLHAAIGTLTRDSYEQMFSLDEQSLVEGGASILQSKGDLGALLFSAASGLTHISERLDQIEEANLSFFKPRGKTELKELSDQIKTLQRDQKELELSVSMFERLKREEKSAEKAYTIQKSELDAARQQYSQLEALTRARDHWEILEETGSKLETYADCPDMPEDVDTIFSERLRTRDTANARLVEIQRNHDSTIEKRDTIEIDDLVLSIAADIISIQERKLSARYDVAEDIEKRIEEQEIIQGEISQLILGIGLEKDTNPESLMLGKPKRDELSQLLAGHRELSQGIKAAEKELADAEKAQADLQNEENATEPEDLSSLEAIVKAVQSNQQLSELAALEKSTREQKVRVDQALGQLTPWAGDSDALNVLSIPDTASLQSIARRNTEIEAEGKHATQEQSDLTLEKDKITARRSSIEAQLDAASDDALATVIDKRDGLWAKIASRNQPVSESEAENLGRAIAEVDTLQTTRLLAADQIAQLRQLDTALAELDVKIQHNQARLDNWKNNASEHQKSFTKILNSLDLPVDWTPENLSNWSQQATSVRDQIGELSSAEQSLSLAQDATTPLIEELHNAMNKAGLPTPAREWKSWLDTANQKIQSWQKLVVTAEGIEKSRQRAKQNALQRKEDLEKLKARLSKWETHLETVLENTWLYGKSIAEIDAALTVIPDLGHKLRSRQDLSQRIKSMEDDKEAFLVALSDLQKKLGLTDDGSSPRQAFKNIEDRLLMAQEESRNLARRKQEAEDTSDALREAKQIVQEDENKLTNLYAQHGVDDQTAMTEQIKRHQEKCVLVEQQENARKGIEREKIADAFADTLELLSEKFGSAETIAAFNLECANIDASIAEIEEDVRELHTAWSEARKSLSDISDEGEITRLESERLALVDEIEEKANTFLRRSAGVLLAREALKEFREKHRSTMMQTASDSFAQMTKGAWAGLSSSGHGDTETLIGSRIAAGGSVAVDKMSRGTSFQLYLALRIAGHAEFAAQHTPLPFFADDILEPFDDDRSAETFALLNKMSKKGQVIYLTHHRHLCEIAKEATEGKIKIHELSDRAQLVQTVG